jgi:gliding motility-associated-like protein
MADVQAQNLVPNGDFETYTQCPDYVSQIDRATGWSRPTTGTSDYFNACLGVPFSMNVPDNQSGYEPAHSGNGYAGFYCFYANTAITTAPDNDREYVTHALSEPLIPGAPYSVEFFVSLADVSKYAVNDIGALLSTYIPTRTDYFAITATPQIMNTSLAMLDSKEGWTKIHGCFVADSAFAYITIGNFHVGAAIEFVQVPTNNPLTFYSYYFVDDVSVQATDAPQLGPDIRTCESVTLAVIDPIDDATYTWSTGEQGIAIAVDTAGAYSVSMDSGGCLLSDTIVVHLDQPIPLTLANDTAADLCAHPTLLLDPGPLPPGSSVHWSTGATTARLPVDKAGFYTIAASAPDHCPTTATILVEDLCGSSVYAPNAFTPNNDGVNDLWQPRWTANVDATLEIIVFDRWGRTLFAASGREAAWDGTANGSPVPAGVYAWRGQARDQVTSRDRMISGYVCLIR